MSTSPEKHFSIQQQQKTNGSEAESTCSRASFLVVLPLCDQQWAALNRAMKIKGALGYCKKDHNTVTVHKNTSLLTNGKAKHLN